MSRRSGLGRGLAALIPPAPGGPPGPPEHDEHDERDPTARDGGPAAPVGAAPAPSAPAGAAAGPAHEPATVAEVPTDRIVPNPRQPREVFDEEELAGLAVSLRDLGLLQPLVVRPRDDGRYELIAGERRLRAARLAGMDRVPVLIRHTDDADLLKEALVENIHRVQLNPLEEAAAYQQLLDEFGFTQEELAARLGKSRPTVTNALRLLTLPPSVQRRVAAGVLTAGHAKALLALDDATVLERVADRVVREGMSVRATEELVRVRLLGEGDASARRRSRSRAVPVPELVELQDDLSDALAARVRITMGARTGRLSIDVASVDDLERLVGIIVSGLDRSAPAPTDLAPPGGAPSEPDRWVEGRGGDGFSPPEG
jgi:ParB family transcriptional regulator, chromosome partitioning protein